MTPHDRVLTSVPQLSLAFVQKTAAMSLTVCHPMTINGATTMPNQYLDNHIAITATVPILDHCVDGSEDTHHIRARARVKVELKSALSRP
jgi:hypothetical protein